MSALAVVPNPKPASKLRGSAATKLKPSTVDAAAQKYLALKLEEESLDKRMTQARIDLLKLIATHGITPSRAEKSKRIDGNIYSVTATYGQSSSLDQFAVADLRRQLSEHRLTNLFALIFDEETKYTLNGTAHEMVEKARNLPRGFSKSRLRMLFRRCFKISDRKPSIAVEEKVSK